MVTTFSRMFPLLRAVALGTSLRLLVLVSTLDRPDQALGWLYLTDPLTAGLVALVYVRATVPYSGPGRLLTSALAGCLPFVLTFLFLGTLDLSPEPALASQATDTLLRTAAAGLLGGLLGRTFGPWEYPYGAREVEPPHATAPPRRRSP
ncbi:MAG: hypothetical protein ACREMO_07705 [Gemmatimonadales bacterium]